MALKRNLSSWRDVNPLASALGLGFASLGLLTLLNASLGLVPAFRALYILPIWIATRFAGRVAGFVLVGFATIANVWLDYRQGIHGAQAITGVATWLIVLSLVMLLVAQVEDALSTTKRLAQQDPLTGLFNRRGLEREGRRLLHQAIRDQGTVSVVMVDCDRLKSVNDEFGHRAGDEVLRFLAKTLKENTREADVVSRLGGDEFVLVLDRTDAAEADKILNRVQQAFDAGMARRGFDASLSIGLAQNSQGARDLRTLLARADKEMYLRKEAKRSGPLAS